MEIHVQFSDATEQKITGYFSCAQDPKVWQNVGTVTLDDWRWAEFFLLLPEGARLGLPEPQSA